jgi:peroxiredoxin
MMRERRNDEVEMQQQDFPLPYGLPPPIDDGAADHLRKMEMPHIFLQSTAGRLVDLSDLRAPRTVIYCYPMTGVPRKPLPEDWDMIPGARGCTPQTRSFRDRHPEFLEYGVAVFGLSTQTTQYQLEMARRLKLPFEILSDCEFALCDALRLPTFETAGMRLVKRLTLIVRNSRIEHVFYPVFPPDQSADLALRWLRSNPSKD